MTKANTAPRIDQKDVYTKITDQIITAIEAGAGDWKMPWHKGDAADTMRPVNAISGKPYRGVNVVALWAAADGRGFSSNRWATYRQWQDIGAQVRKGEKSTLIVFWKFFDDAGKTDAGADDGEADDRQSESRRAMARGYFVFNAEQVGGYAAPAAPPKAPAAERIEHAEEFFAATGMELRHGGSRAYYRPSEDRVQMPPFEAFHDPLAYYATLSHEATHWTGSKDRLDRNLSLRFGSEAYAAEELVAELGAAFLCADLGLANEPKPDHAAYVASWLKVLKSDSRAIFTAAAKAQQAADYLHGLQPEEPGEVLARMIPAPQQPIRSLQP